MECDLHLLSGASDILFLMTKLSHGCRHVQLHCAGQLLLWSSGTFQTTIDGCQVTLSGGLNAAAWTLSLGSATI